MRERFRQSPNLAADLLLQASDEAERQLTAVVEQISPRERGKNRWHVLYFTDAAGQAGHLNVWNPHLLEGLTPGEVIDLNLRKNDRGYWDIAELRRTGEAREGSSQPVTGETTINTSPHPSTPLRPLREALSRESGMRSMNALTAAATITAAMIESKLLKPHDVSEAIEVVRQFHNAFVALHASSRESGDQANSSYGDREWTE